MVNFKRWFLEVDYVEIALRIIFIACCVAFGTWLGS